MTYDQAVALLEQAAAAHNAYREASAKLAASGAEAIRTMLRESGKTATAFAAAVGMGASYLSRITNESCPVTPTIAAMFVRYQESRV